ncbi:HipA domain-containing protein [Alteromonas sp. ALT199]|nr:HipA domain-containing protein [Alteromonas sp. ALT199]
MITSEMKFTFRYDQCWLKSGYAISPHLPLDKPVDTKSLCRFLNNLLPEGSALECLLNNYSLSRHNLGGLLKHIASESAGILHFQYPDTIEPEVRELSEQELGLRISQGTNVVIFDGLFRLNVAGVQKKLNVYLTPENTYQLGTSALPSTHILKFMPPAYSIVLNELFCMLMAEAIGLPVAKVEFRRLTRTKRLPDTLLVKRFDRDVSEDGTVSKRHIIDGCQALNLPPEHKYERLYGSHKDVAHCRDGANLSQLFGFVRERCQSEDAIEQLLAWVCFNLVIGNSDAHAKNISFYVDPSGIHLAPFYDLVSIIFEAKGDPKLDTSLAMAIGDEFDIEAITAYHLLCFAEEVGITPEQLKNVLLGVATACIKTASLSLCRDAKFSRRKNHCLTQLIELIKQRANHFLGEVALFDEIQRTLF